MTPDDLTLEELFDGFDIDAFFAARKLRADRPWVYDIIRVLWRRPDGLSLQRLYRDVWDLRHPSGLSMPRAYEATLRSAINHHTRQSSSWNHNPADDLFFSPRGRGTWAVDVKRAEAWLKAHELPAL
jgi:hypothetical protein